MLGSKNGVFTFHFHFSVFILRIKKKKKRDQFSYFCLFRNLFWIHNLSMKYTLFRLGYVPYFRKKKCLNWVVSIALTSLISIPKTAEHSHLSAPNLAELTPLSSLSSRLDRFRQAALVSHLSTAVRIFECPGYSLCNVKCFFHGYVRATRLVMLTYNFNCYDASFSECWQVYLF